MVTIKPEEEKLKKKLRKSRPRRMRWPVTHQSPDIDLMKPEKLGGDFCGCGQRMVDGALCLRCVYDSD